MSKIANASEKSYFNSERFAEAQENLNSTLGTNATISGDMAENYSALVYRLGLSNEEATKFNLTAISLGKNSKLYTGQINTQVKLLNGQNKLQIDSRQILKDVSNTSSRIQLSTKATGKDLVAAVYSAKALGMNMAQLEKTADSLLNFESSISAELDKRTVDFQRNLGISEKEAFKLQDRMSKIANTSEKSYFNSERFAEAQENLNSTLGTNATT